MKVFSRNEELYPDPANEDEKQSNPEEECKRDDGDGYKRFWSYGGLSYGVRYGHHIETCGNTCDKISLEFKNFNTGKVMCICVQDARITSDSSSSDFTVHFKMNTTNVHMSSLWKDVYDRTTFTLSSFEGLLRSLFNPVKNPADQPMIIDNGFYPSYMTLADSGQCLDAVKLRRINKTSQFIGSITITGDTSFVDDRLFSTAVILKALELMCVVTEEYAEELFIGDHVPVTMNDLVCREIKTRNIRAELEDICGYIREIVGLNEKN